MNISKKLVLVAAGFLLILVIGSVAALRYFSDRIGSSDESRSTTTDPGPGGAFPESAINYTDSGFSPATISVGVERGLGCVVRIVNRSNHDVKLGVSPHKAAGDPGPDYPPIKPGDGFLFDPRFPGFTELNFHDHGRPELQFLVEFEKSCQ